MQSDTIIVGSGISGLMTGCRLLEAGRRVTILEKGQPAREASWAGGGILSPLQPWAYPEPVVRLAAWSQSIYGRVCVDLFETTGIDPEYKQDGMLVLQPDESPADAWIAQNGVGRLLPSGEVSRLAPGVRHASLKSFWFESVAQARNPRLLQSLLVRFGQLGGELRTNTPVTELVSKSGRIVGVRTDQTFLRCGEVVVCAGAWTQQLLGGIAKIRPIRGQILLLKGLPGLLKPVIVCGSTYLIPRRDGRILVGSTTEDVGFDKSTDSETREYLLNEAVGILPSLAQLPVEKHWAGLRPSPPSGVPVIGPVPETSGLWLNAGHYRNGLVMAPGAAALLVSQMTGSKDQPVDPAPYQVSALTPC